MPSPWRWMYAQLYNWNVRKWGRRRDPEVFALGALTLITYLHFLPVFAAYEVLVHKHVHVSHERIVVMLAALGFFHYVRFLYRGEADSMIAELELHDAAETRRDFRKLGAVVLSTIALMVLVGVATAVAGSPAN